MEQDSKNYEFSLRLLGNEVFAVKFSSNATSSKWLAIGIVASAAALTFLVVFGKDIFSLIAK